VDIALIIPCSVLAVVTLAIEVDSLIHSDCAYSLVPLRDIAALIGKTTAESIYSRTQGYTYSAITVTCLVEGTSYLNM
jgi:hypothetical protein